MNGAFRRWATALPVFAYGLVVLAYSGSAWTPLAVLGVLLLAVPLASLATDRLADWWFVPAAFFLGATALLAVAEGGLRGPWEPSLLLGALAGSPLLTVAVYGRLRASSAASLTALMAGLTTEALVLATLRALPSTGSGRASPAVWASTFSQVLGQQAAALRALATGQTIPVAPVGYTGDVWFDGLAILALFGLLASWLDVSARSLSTEGTTSAAFPGAAPGGQLAPPPSVGRSGARSLIVAVAAVLVFELSGALSPADALIGVAAIAPVVVLAVTYLSQSRSHVPETPPS